MLFLRLDLLGFLCFLSNSSLSTSCSLLGSPFLSLHTTCNCLMKHWVLYKFKLLWHIMMDFGWSASYATLRIIQSLHVLLLLFTLNATTLSEGNRIRIGRRLLICSQLLTLLSSLLDWVGLAVCSWNNWWSSSFFVSHQRLTTLAAFDRGSFVSWSALSICKVISKFSNDSLV